jgi:glutathione S-transferase
MMRLIGMLDSPYVRRVAVSLKLMEMDFELSQISVFRGFDEFRSINPVVKAPTLITDEGVVLMDSGLILEHADRLAGPSRSLMPAGIYDHAEALHVIGFALAACEKTVQIVYERNLRPAEKQHQPWLDRVQDQLLMAYGALERAAAQPAAWFGGSRLMQPDVSVAVAWRFTQHAAHGIAKPSDFPRLAAHSARAEILPAFVETSY